MKAYTNLEQSKKLAEILPIESADMHWQYIEEDNGQLQWFCFPKDFSINQHNTVLAWSLASLLDVLPNKLQIVLAINDFQGDRKEKYVIGSVEHDRYDCYADNPIDACYELILKLNELKML